MLQFEDKQISENRSKNFDQSLEEKISECIENLEKNPEHLNHADLQIIKTFARKNQFFKQIQEEQGENILKECFKRITLEVYEKNQVVFEQGERAHSFFIILIGNVSVYVYKDPKVDIGEENLDRPTLIKMKEIFQYKQISSRVEFWRDGIVE
ncbi:unnamed protein product [Paramecium sonneborni]|uniref:Cyclic nucleotide-binding domain-containing protein n=1 Tax=Paramecium sonneborni TaxID=65129 RepID=A0A8S1QN88_9CILI|nr:unnamed protein product [Paramecium sonneborni]